jgi:hypothetical protein
VSSPFMELRAQAKAERYLAGVEAALAVTDIKEPRSEIFTSRNAAVGLGPWTRFSHEHTQCHYCKRCFDDSEVVYIAKLSSRPGRYAWVRRYPICGPCARQLPGNGSHGFYPPKPCGFCERRIAVSYYATNRRRPDFCCDLCASREANRVAKDIRSRTRENKTCKQCQAKFDGTRADANFCSAACRQRAYRERCAITNHWKGAREVISGAPVFPAVRI